MCRCEAENSSEWFIIRQEVMNYRHRNLTSFPKRETKKKEAIFHSNYYFCWPVMFQTNLKPFTSRYTIFLLVISLTQLEPVCFVHFFMLWYQTKIHLEIAEVNLTQGFSRFVFHRSFLFELRQIVGIFFNADAERELCSEKIQEEFYGRLSLGKMKLNDKVSF